MTRRPNPTRAELDRWIEHAAVQSENAARRNKPAMWAYWLSVHDGLVEWFRDVQDDEQGGGIAGAALALIQHADEEVSDPDGSPRELARWWSLRVYAVRVLRTWVPGPMGRRERGSLAWLRARAGEART